MIDLGLPISLAGCAISLYGIYLNNQAKDHLGAMVVWGYSNPILTTYFVGQTFGFWNGGLSSAAMAVLYGVFTVSNWRGLVKEE